MRFEKLEQWLDFQMSLHDKAIDLGLDRVRIVGNRLGLTQIAPKVITIAGTNGKGSTVAAYENWLCQAGYRVASYTSPHLLKYNERIRHNIEPVSDLELCQAFEQVEQARDDIALTYFEYGTLAALYLMQQWPLDFALLEVGLGGRLDAVNIIDADLVHITPVALDHQAWLGSDREKIGYEKAGVLRAAIPVVLNDADPPDSVLSELKKQNCRYLRSGKDYRIGSLDNDLLEWSGPGRTVILPEVLPGLHQQHNLAGVLAGLSLLLSLDDYTDEEIAKNFVGTKISGRFEERESPLQCRLILDVGHNQHAAAALAENLKQIRHQDRKVVVLLGMLEDKQADLFVSELKSVVDHWWTMTLDCDRGVSALELKQRIKKQVNVESMFDNPVEVLDHALSSLNNLDIMLVTGSFVTTELMLHALSDSETPRH